MEPYRGFVGRKVIKVKGRGKDQKGLIVDVRDNPGGYLDSSVYLVSEFLPQGKLIVKQTSSTQTTKTYQVDRPGKLLEIPLIVLINKGSASASEILAGTLQHHSQSKGEHQNLIVFLVGTPTFGKGSVQELIPIKNGCALKVTSMLYYLPDDKTIQAERIVLILKRRSALKL